MDRMLVVVFDNEETAYEGSKALQQLDGEGSIAVYAAAVLAKKGSRVWQRAYPPRLAIASL